MESFLHDAQRILDTAVAADDNTCTEYVICLSRAGALRILSDVTGWSLPALALELGAEALYRVGRLGGLVRVEGWSYGRKCLLTRDLSGDWWAHPRRRGYATLQMLEAGGSSQNERVPHVRNS